MSVTVMKDDLGFNKHNFLFIFVFFFVPFFTFLCTYEEDMINEDDIGYIVQYYYED
jgi:hypothetical protein